MKYLPLIILIAFAIVSCRKNSGPLLKDEQKQFIVGKKWQLKKWELDQPSNNPNGSPPHYEEVYPFRNTAVNDDFEIYFADSTFFWDNGIVLGDNINRLTGKWYFTADGKSLFKKFDAFPEGGLWKIAVTATQLKLTQVNKAGHRTQINTYEIIE